MEPLPVKDRDELMALALALETRAQKYLEALSERADLEGRGDLAKLFCRLAEEEKDHCDAVLAIGDDDRPVAEVDPARLRQLGISEPPDLNAQLHLSIYDCLAIAVRNEEKAFAFYSKVAGHPTDPTIRDLAETLAKEELEHAAILRRARRRAYQGTRELRTRWPRNVQFANRPALLEQAVKAEAAWLDQFDARGLGLPALQEIAALVRGALPIPDEALPPDDPDETDLPRGFNRQEVLRAALREAQAAFDFYDRIFGRSTDPEVLLTAQDLTAMSLERIRLLTAALHEKAGPPGQVRTR